jgi:hypothetical protein
MRVIILALVVGMAMFQGVVMASTLVDDIKELQRKNGAVDIDITELVSRHISVGQTRNSVETYLKGERFKLYPQRDLLDGSQVMIAAYDVPSNHIFGFHHEIKIILTFTGEQVASVRGDLIYRAF